MAAIDLLSCLDLLSYVYVMESHLLALYMISHTTAFRFSSAIIRLRHVHLIKVGLSANNVAQYIVYFKYYINKHYSTKRIILCLPFIYKYCQLCMAYLTHMP